MKVSVMIARFPYGGQEHPDVATWLVGTVQKMKQDPHISEVLHNCYDDTPITMTRNRCLRQALDMGVDYVLMVDSDMCPDVHSNPRNKGLFLPDAKPFWEGAFSFALEHNGPCLVAAPYCGPPPDECVYVFHWTRREENDPNVNIRLNMISREQAALRSGFEQVAALPTGLILIDMRGVKQIPAPWFRYEWKDEHEDEKASTEDVYFTRNCSMAGIPNYVYWDAWAGHHKRKCVRKPTPLTADCVNEQLHEAIRRGHKAGQKLVFLGEGKNPLPPPRGELCSHPLPQKSPTP